MVLRPGLTRSPGLNLRRPAQSPSPTGSEKEIGDEKTLFPNGALGSTKRAGFWNERDLSLRIQSINLSRT